MPIDPLIDLLAAQSALLSELRELTIRQRHALLAGDVALVSDLAGRAETLATRHRLLEEERSRLDGLLADEERDDPRLRAARRAAASTFGALLREAAVAGTVLERLGDTLAARQAIVDPLVSSNYQRDGRPRTTLTSSAVSAEG